MVERRGVYRVLVGKPTINPLNAELNPTCHFLALLGGATIVVVSRLRVKSPLARPRHRWECNVSWIFRKWNVGYGPVPAGSGWGQVAGTCE